LAAASQGCLVEVDKPESWAGQKLALAAAAWPFDHQPHAWRLFADVMVA